MSSTPTAVARAATFSLPFFKLSDQQFACNSGATK